MRGVEEDSSRKGFFAGGILIHLKLLFVAASWGLAWAAGREVALSLPESVAAWYRYAMTIPLFFIWLLFTRGKGHELVESTEGDSTAATASQTSKAENVRPVMWKPGEEMFYRIAWVAFFSTFLYQLLFMHGMSRTAASDASVLITFNPAFTALLAIPLLGRRVTAKLFLGLIIGLAGVALVTGWSPNTDIPSSLRILGDFLIMCAAASWAVSTILIKRILEDEEIEDKPTPLAIVAWASLFGWLLLTPLAVFDLMVWGSAAIPNMKDILWLVYLAAISTVLAYAWFAEGVDKIGATAAATYVYLVPFFGILSGVLLLGEAVGLALFAGLALILVGVKIAQESSNESES